MVDIVNVLFDVEMVDLQADLVTMMFRSSPQGVHTFLEGVAEPYLEDRLEQRFVTEGDDAVGQWLPLRQATQVIRASQGFGAAHPINIRTREMIDYMLNASADVTLIGSDGTLTFPSRGAPPSVEQKMQTAQAGKSYPRTPPRPVIALSDTDSVLITRDLASYMMQGLIGSFTWI